MTRTAVGTEEEQGPTCSECGAPLHLHDAQVEQGTNRTATGESWVCENGHWHGISISKTPWGSDRYLGHGSPP
jgi:hypothetical protein